MILKKSIITKEDGKRRCGSITHRRVASTGNVRNLKVPPALEKIGKEGLRRTVELDGTLAVGTVEPTGTVEVE